MKLIAKFTFLSIIMLLTSKIYSADFKQKIDVKLRELKKIILKDDKNALEYYMKANKIHWSKSVNSDEDTLLHVAVNYGSIACVQFLLTLKDIDIHKENSLKLDIFKTASGFGQTPLDQAIYWATKFPQRKNAEKILELLEEHTNK